MNYIITKNKQYFQKIGEYNYLALEEVKIDSPILAYDSETEGLNPLTDDVFCVQISDGKDCYLFDLQKHDTPLDKGKQIFIKEIFPIIKDKILVGHNISFDLGFLYKKNFFPERVYDTMVASKILHNGDKFIHNHSFGYVMERELGLVYDKSEQKTIHKIKLSNPKTIKYSFDDVDKLLDLHYNLFEKLTKYEAIPTYELNCKYLLGMVYMEMCGLPFSTSRWKEKMLKDEKDSLNAQKVIIDYIYDNLPEFRDNQLNIFETIKRIKPQLSSVKQMLPVFKKLGINVIDDEEKESLEENVINKSSHEFVKLWLDYKEAEHRVTTYGSKILEKVRHDKKGEERLYTRFNPILDTCRISTRKGEINFLNFPSDKDTRKCFEAKKGFVMIGCDYSNQESRVLADISKDVALIDSITNNIDVHCQLAKEIYPELKSLSDDEIKKNHKDKRQEGKIANFTVAFGGNGYTISKNLNTSLEHGERIYNAYKSLHKEVFEWGENNLKKAIEKGWIDSTMGFKLKLPYFEEFKKDEEFIKSKDKSFWELYSEGKKEYKEFQRIEELRKKDKTIGKYKVINFDTYNLYLNNKIRISNYFKIKSEYFRLCLNNPIKNGCI